MLLLNCSSAESTPAVTSSVFCTVRLWLINPANSRFLLLPAPLDLYSSYRWLSELLCITWVLSPYFSCCWGWSAGSCLRHPLEYQTGLRRATTGEQQQEQPMPAQESFRRYVYTYRSPSKEYLRRFAAPNALEELVNNVLGQVHLHGLHRRRVGSPGLDISVRSPNQGNASRGKQSSRHDGLLVWMSLQEADRGVKLAPGCCQR
jgi:hypothetical protein